MPVFTTNNHGASGGTHQDEAVEAPQALDPAVSLVVIEDHACKAPLVAHHLRPQHVQGSRLREHVQGVTISIAQHLHGRIDPANRAIVASKRLLFPIRPIPLDLLGTKPLDIHIRERLRRTWATPKPCDTSLPGAFQRTSRFSCLVELSQHGPEVHRLLGIQILQRDRLRPRLDSFFGKGVLTIWGTKFGA